MIQSIINRLRRNRQGRSLPSSITTPDFDDDRRSIINTVIPYTMTTAPRIDALCNAVSYVVRHNIGGAIVECGVWRGGSMMAAALTLRRLTCQNRDLWLFDTFDGMTPPSELDARFDGIAAATLLAESDRTTSNIWAHCGIDNVRRNLASTGYDDRRIHYVQGRVEDTLPYRAPESISVLRLDTDWFESTYHELQHLFPRLVLGGVLIIDDYGHWNGARRAVDQYFAEIGKPILLNRIDYTGRIGVKCYL